MDMDSYDGLKLVEQAVNKDIEDRLYAMYVQVYPLMIKKEIEHKSFEEFRKRAAPNKNGRSRNTRKPKEETKEQIYSKVKDIMNNYKV